MLETMNDWLQDEDALSSHMLRFMAHFTLFLRASGLETQVNLTDCIHHISAKQKPHYQYTTTLHHSTQHVIFISCAPYQSVTGTAETRLMLGFLCFRRENTHAAAHFKLRYAVLV